MTRVLCRVDAGPSSGLGHLRRCISLAEGLSRRHVEAVFLAPPLQAVRDEVERAGATLVPLDVPPDDLGRARDRDLALDTARTHRCDRLVVDSYHTDGDYVPALRRAGMRVAVLDDLAERAQAAHIVVNAGAGAHGLDYRSTTGDTRFLLGPQYALLGEPFRSLPERVVASEVRSVLVTVGGSDQLGVLARVLRILDTIAADFVITAVVGPFMDTGHRASDGYRHCVRLMAAPSDLSALMCAADLAVSAGGQTLYELAATGTPTVAIQVFGNQALNVDHLAAAGVVGHGGAIEDPAVDAHIRAAVVELMGSHQQRVEMSRAGQRLVDGQGAARVAEAITDL